MAFQVVCRFDHYLGAEYYSSKDQLYCDDNKNGVHGTTVYAKAYLIILLVLYLLTSLAVSIIAIYNLRRIGRGEYVTHKMSE